MENNLIETFMDENNTDTITLYSDKNEKVEFEQIAVVPYKEGTYAILKPIEEIDDVEEDEAFVFEILDDGEGGFIEMVEDEDIIANVFEEYYKMLDEE